MYIRVLYVPHCLPLTIPIVDGMNDLQHISEEIYGPVLVTLNPPMHPQADKVIGRYDYAHPVLNAEVEINILIASSCPAVSLISFPFLFCYQAVLSQSQMSSIQGKRGISFAGAWLGYGFHEDGFTSGLRAVVDHIDGITLPFEIRYPDREPQAVWVATFFDFFEGSGCRVFLGVFLSLGLGLARALLGIFFDFAI